MSTLYELHLYNSSGHGLDLSLAMHLSLDEEWTCLAEISQSTTAKPQHWHESVCTDARFSPFPHVSAQRPDTCRRELLLFPDIFSPRGLHFTVENVSYVETHARKSKAIVALCSQPGGSGHKLLQTKWDVKQAPLDFKRETHSSYSHVAN